MTTEEYRKKKPLAIFLHYFKNHKRLFAVDISCALMIALIDLAFPLVTRASLYDLLPNGKFGVFFSLMAACLAFYVLRSFLNYIVCYYGHTFGIRVEADIRADLFRHMQEMSYDFYDANRTGQLMSRLTSDLFELTELAHHGPEDVLTSSVTIIGALIVMASIRWELALVVGILVPIFLVVIMSMRSGLSSVSVGVKQKTGHINTEIESSLSGIRTAKAFANEDVEIRRFDAANEIYKTSKREFHKAMGRFNSTMELFLTVLNVVVIAVGGFMIMQDKMDYRDLVTFSLYIATFVSPMRKLSTLSEMFANGFAGLNRFVEIMRTEPTIQDTGDAKALENVKGSITVDHVSFTYDGTLPVLHDVSLDVTPGETLAIVGPSGGGKSTLCQLIPRFYDVTDGSISIDGTDVRAIQQHSLHKTIGIVQQDVFLFADTILENIRYGRPDATDEEVIEAAKRAEIYADIQAMPNGFQTYVGERGTLLSGGQKQRVAIARIFLMDPAILILDEATSALDSVTEAKIQRAFDNLSRGRTTLIIAHRLSTIRSANRIISIADGRITEAGTHEELLQKGGVYADLYNTQNALALEAMKM
ncbi:ABC transporter ATP-binding protein/permease [Pseudoflavonifractor sp. MSJ-30]|uniref:ABC transporter ATP-binding protein n=1 Tax=Pseudoflavonifractor sp. MSJ-30 TaxID=2841525 RepID=UPI001C1051D4|nr:ABC transporter ATP-binding protein [Pseudoflavonifractor sp. MSJ-30]MBU5453558.1 ABC transporter ATP-binding protein/permease [Pseudoflavonifractor sp. MSJ-30]